ncbi:MAG TPA: hypothetical protein VGP82_25255 [Ktedonobacterales bacterium]|nr:hypothetical protein [Ktedonobacterales bacterium]
MPVGPQLGPASTAGSAPATPNITVLYQRLMAAQKAQVRRIAAIKR